MIALIDGDIVVYRVACACLDDDSEDYVFDKVDSLIDKITFFTDSEKHQIFLTGKNNFRKQIYPEYKAQRPKEKPYWFDQIRTYLVEEYNAVVCDGQEADDMLGIVQCTSSEPTIICTIDKDLLMIPGKHYNFVKDEYKTIREFDGLRNFYTQCLMGDRSDNIKGIPNIGPKKAEKILAHCRSEQDLFKAVREAYSNDEEFLMNARVLWIRRKDNDDWREKFNALIQIETGGASLEDPQGELPFS